MKTSTISKIQAHDESTWKDTIFLTFDIDWAHDDVLSDTIDLVEKADVAATWFVTHDTPVLKRLRENPKFELGIHPNFNFLLEGDRRNGGNGREVIERMMAIVPEAKSVRSHSMTQSSILLELFVEVGLTHDVNHFVPHHAGIELKPWIVWNGLCKVPYCWEDDVQCLFGREDKMSDVMSLPGIKVFDFHPIHVFLNTESLERYELTRPLHSTPEALVNHRFPGHGARTGLLSLIAEGIDHCCHNGMQF